MGGRAGSTGATGRRNEASRPQGAAAGGVIPGLCITFCRAVTSQNATARTMMAEMTIVMRLLMEIPAKKYGERASEGEPFSFAPEDPVRSRS